MSDDRSKAPSDAKCDDTEEPVIVNKPSTDKSKQGYSQFEIRLTETAPPPLGSKPKDADLANTIFWLLSNKMGLPLPSSTVAHVYADKSSFIEGLIEVGGETSEMATKKVNTFGAFASRKGLLLRSDSLARMPLTSRAEIFAHELTHISQCKLGEGGRRWPAQWLREGHADWEAFQVLEIMGLRPFSESRARFISAIKASPTAASAFPDLDALDTIAKWIDAKNRFGRPGTYGQSFLAVDWLIERYGHAKLIELLGKYGSASESGKAWRSVYPISQRQFINEFHNRLQTL